MESRGRAGCVSTTGIRRVRARVVLVALLYGAMCGNVYAQQLSAAALQQIQELLSEKAARTPTQQKIESHFGVESWTK